MSVGLRSPRPLSEAQIRQFVTEGFVKIDAGFPMELAEAARAVLWRDLGLAPDAPAAWTRPVVRLGTYAGGPFAQAANTATLVDAYDQLVGRGRWLAPTGLGTFPIRFPSDEDPGDDGWHVDMSFDWHKPDFMDWRINLLSRGRALLMLFLFSDVGEQDAPTRLRRGSHHDVALMLADAGPAGLTMRELVKRLARTEGRPEALATGAAGTVYLCHPFLVHAAQRHRGDRPRFLAQPPLLPRGELQLTRADGSYSPVEAAVRQALGLA